MGPEDDITAPSLLPTAQPIVPANVKPTKSKPHKKDGDSPTNVTAAVDPAAETTTEPTTVPTTVPTASADAVHEEEAAFQKLEVIVDLLLPATLIITTIYPITPNYCESYPAPAQLELPELSPTLQICPMPHSLTP